MIVKIEIYLRNLYQKENSNQDLLLLFTDKNNFSSFSNYIRFTRVYSSEVLPESSTSVAIDPNQNNNEENLSADENNDINDIIQEENPIEDTAASVSTTTSALDEEEED